MSAKPLDLLLNALTEAGCQPRRSGAGYSARCPAHDDGNPSLSASAGTDGRALVFCQAGCSTDDVLVALKLTAAELFPPDTDRRDGRAEPVATYDYVDEIGRLLSQVVRMAPKGFWQRRPDGNGGWVKNLGNTRRVLYRLPEVLAAVAAGRTVYVVEGEKDVEAVVGCGEVATCNSGGAGKWGAEHARALYGAEVVVVVADKDDAGRAHAVQVAKSLRGHVGQVVIMEALVGKDAADHLAAGYSVEDFQVTDDLAEGSSPGRGAANAQRPSGSAARLTHRPASAVQVTRPVWLWRYWLVAGAVQLLVGRQGSGKSTLAAWVVAQLSSGRPWPGETEGRAPVRCAMLSLEEPADRLAARLVAAGADLDAVEILGDVEGVDDEGRPFRRRWRLPGDCGLLETLITELGAEMVTIDGLGYAVAGDSHNYANVGSALSALSGVAERTGAVILGLTHPPKGNADAVTAAIGSTAWTAVARISWVMGLDPSDEAKLRRVVRPAPGSNYRLPDHGLSFLIAEHDESEAGFITGLGDSDVAAEDITSPPEPDSPEELSKLDEARDFVRRIMADGPVRANEATAAAKAGGIEDRTLRRAGRRRA